jgi:hypothetical protein
VAHATRDTVQRAAGDTPVSQNSTACEYTADWELAPNGVPSPDSVDVPSPEVLRTLVNSKFNLSVRLAELYCSTDSGCSN